VKNAILGKDFNLGMIGSLFHAFIQGKWITQQMLCFWKLQGEERKGKQAKIIHVTTMATRIQMRFLY
jgi:hypothetical protein